MNFSKLIEGFLLSIEERTEVFGCSSNLRLKSFFFLKNTSETSYSKIKCALARSRK